MGDKLNIENLKPHKRNREIYGDIGKLEPDFLNSIKEKGILVPLIVTEEGVILSGHQRYFAAKYHGLKEVPVEVVNFKNDLDELEALIEYNRYRIKSEIQMGREYNVIIEIEKERAKRRKLEGNKKGGLKSPKTENKLGGKLPPNLPKRDESKRSREQARKQVGLPQHKAEKLAKIINAADKGITKGVDAVRAIEKGESVHKVYDKYFKPPIKKTQEQLELERQKRLTNEFNQIVKASNTFLDGLRNITEGKYNLEGVEEKAGLAVIDVNIGDIIMWAVQMELPNLKGYIAIGKSLQAKKEISE